MMHRTLSATLFLGGMVASGLAAQATSGPATTPSKMKNSTTAAPQVETATFALG